jgi:hypothetical protein
MKMILQRKKRRTMKGKKGLRLGMLIDCILILLNYNLKERYS